MNPTMMDVAVVLMWITVIDIAILVNVAAWVVIKWLLKIAKEI